MAAAHTCTTHEDDLSCNAHSCPEGEDHFHTHEPSDFLVSHSCSTLLLIPVDDLFLILPAPPEDEPEPCEGAVGVGIQDRPHFYVAGTGVAAFAQDSCPEYFSGELGIGVNGVWLFAREGAGTHGGDGVVACYGEADPTAVLPTGHHGAHTTIRVEDAFLGGSVAFSVTRDYNRSDDIGIHPGNNAGDSDCGDSLIEPCDPADPSEPFACNPLDRSVYVPAREGICEGTASLGSLTPPDPNVLLPFVQSIILGAPVVGDGSLKCRPGPGPNAWTVPDGGDLQSFAGADGAIVVFMALNLRPDGHHAGAGTVGGVWTS